MSTFQSLCYLLVLLLSLFISSFRFFHPFLSFPCLSLPFFCSFMWFALRRQQSKMCVCVFLFFSFLLQQTIYFYQYSVHTFKFLVRFWFRNEHIYLYVLNNDDEQTIPCITLCLLNNLAGTFEKVLKKHFKLFQTYEIFQKYHFVGNILNCFIVPKYYPLFLGVKTMFPNI